MHIFTIPDFCVYSKEYFVFCSRTNLAKKIYYKF